MRTVLTLTALTMGLAVAQQQPKPAPAPPAPVSPPAAAPGDTGAGAATTTPSKAAAPVEAVISPQIAKLPAPLPPAIPQGITMVVSSEDPEAQREVLQGLNCLHGGWDFEAYRHFCAALKKDPQCLMAHFGVALSLMDPEPSLRDASNAAVDRMLALVEHDVGSELEHGYAFGLATFLKEGPARAALAFEKASEKFPNDAQLKLLAAFFGRTGYDPYGGITAGQEKSEKALAALIKQYPENPVYLSAYLAIRAESPDPRADLELAHKLVKLAPDYPPFQHLAGHYEWRCGNHGKAAEAFFQAGQQYLAWMKQSQLTALDCPGWIKAEIYRAVALASKGDYPTALEIAKGLAAIPVPADRAASDGGKLLLWEGRTLATRLLMRRDQSGDVAAALAALPPKDSQKIYGKVSMAPSYYQTLAFALEVRKNLLASHRDEAMKVSTALKLHGEEMARNEKAANGTGERSYYLRAMKSLDIMAPELRGLFVMAGPKTGQGSAFNWFRSACDRQGLSSMMLPPVLLLPMECHLGDYYLSRDESKEAIEILDEGLERNRRDYELLTRLEKALKKAGDKARATEVATDLETLKAE